MISGKKAVKQLQREIREWLEEGIISEEQANILYVRYDVEAAPPWYRNTNYILSGVAVTVTVMGFLLLIGFNWDFIPLPVRMLIGLLPLAASYFFGVRFYLANKMQASELALSLASLLFGANIALQAQIFHISAYYPDGILWWILGSLPLIFFFRSAYMHVIFQFLFVIWLGIQNEYAQFSFWSPLLMCAFLYLSYKKSTPLGLLFSIAALYAFFGNLMHALVDSNHWISIFDPGGLFLYLTAFSLLCSGLFSFVAEDYRKRFAEFVNSLLLFIPIFFLFLAGFAEINSEFGDVRKMGITFWFAIFLFSAAVGIFFFNYKTKQVQADFAVGILIGIFLLLNSLVFLLFVEEGDYRHNSINDISELCSAAANVLFLIFSIWKIYFGIRSRTKSSFISGIFYFLTWAVIRYWVLFENYIFTGFLFMGCGVGLFLLNRYWNKKAKEHEKEQEL